MPLTTTDGSPRVLADTATPRGPWTLSPSVLATRRGTWTLSPSVLADVATPGGSQDAFTFTSTASASRVDLSTVDAGAPETDSEVTLDLTDSEVAWLSTTSFAAAKSAVRQAEADGPLAIGVTCVVTAVALVWCVALLREQSLIEATLDTALTAGACAAVRATAGVVHRAVASRTEPDDG